MPVRKGRKPSKSAKERIEPSDLALAMTGRGATPTWKLFLDKPIEERQVAVVRAPDGREPRQH